MIQTIEMTYRQKVKMYNKIKKDRLVEMLIEANNPINELIIAKRNVEEIYQHKPLPAFRNNSTQGEVITCWQLSFRERMRVLVKGEIWLRLLSFNNHHGKKYTKEQIIFAVMSSVLLVIN